MRACLCRSGILTLVFLGGSSAMAQQVGLGVEGGIRTTDDISGTLTPESKRYIVGPKVDIRLPLRLSLEADALYRRFGYTLYSNGVLASSITRERANSWEFPMLVKYRFPIPRLNPFVGIGYAPRIIHGTDVSSGFFLSGMSPNPLTYYFNQRSTVSYPLTHGTVASAGVDLATGRVRVSPEVRYVHWSTAFLNGSSPDGSSRAFTQQDEFFVMLGISWHSR